MTVRWTPLYLCLLTVVGAPAVTSFRDTPSVPEATRGVSMDARISAVMEAMVAALGGRTVVLSGAPWIVEGHGRENLTAELAGLAPDVATWRPHQERVAVDTRRHYAVAWERNTPRNDYSLRWRRFIMREDSSGYHDWVVDRGAMRAEATPIERRVAMARRIPHLLARQLASDAFSLEWGGEHTIGGRTCDRVSLGLSNGARLRVSIGRNPAVLRRAEYDYYLPGAGVVPVVWDWPEWQPDEHLGQVPRGHRITIAGQLFQEVSYDRYAIDSVAAGALLRLPKRRSAAAHASASSTNDSLPERGEVVPGVHVIDVGGFMVMAVEFEAFVVAAEAPENAPGFEAIPASRDTTPLTAALLDSVAALCPGKPVRYAILSHHHADHMGGAGVYASRGITLIVAPGHERAARAAALGFGARRDSIRIETVAKQRVIEDGTRRLEIVNIGKNPHTDENLFLWLPEERLLFLGDLFYYQAGGEFPPSGRGTINRFFARWLETNELHPRAVYGVHNDGAAGPMWLDRSR